MRRHLSSPERLRGKARPSWSTCDRIRTIVHDHDPRLIDPPQDEDGVFVIRSGANPTLVETINAVWVEDNAVAVVEELLAQPQQLAEDDLGVAAVHEAWEGITDYER